MNHFIVQSLNFCNPYLYTPYVRTPYFSKQYFNWLSQVKYDYFTITMELKFFLDKIIKKRSHVIVNKKIFDLNFKTSHDFVKDYAVSN